MVRGGVNTQGCLISSRRSIFFKLCVILLYKKIKLIKEVLKERRFGKKTKKLYEHYCKYMNMEMTLPTKNVCSMYEVSY